MERAARIGSGLPAGAIGLQVGTRGHLVDLLFCDPLLMRLPAHDPNVRAFDTIWFDAFSQIPAPAALGGLFLDG